MRAIALLVRSLAACLALAAFSVPADREPAKPRNRAPVKLTEEALQIHREAIVIDGHNDLPWQFREKGDLGFSHIDIARPQKELHTDIPRLRQGGLGAQFWSAFVPSSTMKDHTAV